MYWIAMALATTGADAAAERHFHETIEPILVRRCLACHGADKEGGLDLRSRKAIAKGGESGEPAVVAKDLDSSLLYYYVSEGVMPPEETPLPDVEIAALKEWIENGAYFPDRTLNPYAFTTDDRAGLDWWALQPIRKPTLPAVSESSACQTPIDRFILAKLEENGLVFSPPADRPTVIRRLMHDLHGMRPTYEQVERFVNDSRPDAYERLVDDLLASPRYGERWGRHWLDVVRYAESNGFERDRIRLNFWRYRDYVIDSYNQDKPYDRFVIEQLAGDALESDDPQALIATGFLVAGPKNDVDTISELERLNTRQDELDEFVVATMTTFSGLTVGCARCHDHKFDPIPARDYYGLTAAFSGLDRRDRIVAEPREKQEYDVALAAANRRLEKVKAELDALLDPVRERLAAERAEKAEAPLAAVDPKRNVDPFPDVQARFVRFVIRATNTQNEPCLDEIEVYGDGEQNLALAELGAKATASSLLPGYPIHQVSHLNDGQTGNERSWISNEPGSGYAQIELASAAYVNKVVWGRDRNGVYQDRLPTDYEIQASVDGKEWQTVSSSHRRQPYDPNQPMRKVDDNEVLERLTDGQRQRFNRLVDEMAAAESGLKQLPQLPLSYAAEQREVQPAFVLRRGNVRDRQETVLPRALSAVAAVPAELGDDSTTGGIRRLNLAKWLIHPDNPLTARVMANRVWGYHFGQGIVNTPSDFGYNGDRPSHPELLDWLARQFMDNDWKIKRLHRLIVLSAAYRQSSEWREDGNQVDSANRLLWRYSPRRLEAEAIRDNILAACGTLNETMGGPSFRLFQYRDGNVPDYVPIDRPGEDTWRRAVYGFNIRTYSHPLMNAFDCPDPSVQTPNRQSSTTALQALSLMNNPFIFAQCDRLAEKIERAAPDAAEQVAQAYRQTLARNPTEIERDVCVDFVEKHGLASLCRVLFNSSEFLYAR